ncbi:5937cd55-9aab-4e35-9a5a-ab4f32212113 [Sclerotinia trifoliorum]|uniref:5937cd55-9aab-4e35-9a5a-ab4f32212113 n=1 Tax=Sclerotinia trifoliorum TaxID=28548 RepID=A0A8H2VU67_9HELO|nr:5937cd55-9aab-4e35-9a5a-ab4f32212113 [Sclerotinia trifoliorum]
MSMHPNYSHNGSLPPLYYPSPPSMHTSDSGYGSTRGEMGPPSLDLPPQPIEIDLSLRTLPHPAFPSISWEPTLPSTHGFSDLNSPYEPISRIQQLPVDRTTGQAPLLQWYADNDGPWYPKTISDPVSDERANIKVRSNNRAPVAFAVPYREQDHLGNGSFHFGAPPHSDSGYGTRRSVGNASIFSADVSDRDQDCQSLAGHVAGDQPFPGLNEALQSRENRTSEPWPLQLPASINSPGLFCSTCQKFVKTKSELKKHDLRHKKPFVCKYPGCTRAEGFSTTNDLDRHTKSKHPLATTSRAESMKKYHCVVSGCKSKDKVWPRLDNFRSHLKRVHSNYVKSEDSFEKILKEAEFFEQSGLSQDAPLPAEVSTQSTSSSREINESLPKVRDIKSNWKPVYPELIQDLVTPMDTPIEKSFVPDANDRSTTILGPNNPTSDSHTRDTIQPSELYRNPIGVINKIPVESVLSTPVGTKSALDVNLDHVSRPSVERNPLPSAAKASQLSSVSATDAAITEVIRTALAETKNAFNVGTLSMERKVLPNGKFSSDDYYWGSTTDKDACSLDELNKSISSTKYDSLDQEKAVEVFKTLQKFGYIIQKDPNHTRKQNIGSVASNKSDNQVICQVCEKFKGRPCELKKHMKRHERPYGCTFLTCNKTFGSKNDWKRHENSQHFQLESWRCDKEKPEGGACAKVSYRRQTFQDHLKKEHGMLDQDAVRIKVEACRIGRNCQSRFWCGFCESLIDLQRKGLHAWTERFDHIDDHFMGRRGTQKQGIQDWIPVDGDKPKGDVASPNSLGESPSKDGREESSPDSTNDPGRSSPEPVDSTRASSSLLGQESTLSRKRERSDDENDRPTKYTKITEIVYCCQCSDDPGRTLTLSPKCTSCNHHYCNDCKRDSIGN